MSQEWVQVDIKEHILDIGLQRQEKKNALNIAMYQALTHAIKQAENDPTIRVLFLHGNEDCFCSGNDLQEFQSLPHDQATAPALEFLRCLSQARKPIVVAVSGPAIGIGSTLLLHCDLVYAADSASFQLPFVNLGLCPEAGASLLLPRIMGYPRAAELFLLGQCFTAQRAQELGLVNAVYAENYCLDNAMRQAELLAQQPPAAVRATKALLKQHGQQGLEQAFDNEAEHFRQALASPEAAEAIAAFLEHRQADFSRFS